MRYLKNRTMCVYVVFLLSEINKFGRKIISTTIDSVRDSNNTIITNIYLDS